MVELNGFPEHKVNLELLIAKYAEHYQDTLQASGSNHHNLLQDADVLPLHSSTAFSRFCGLIDGDNRI